MRPRLVQSLAAAGSLDAAMSLASGVLIARIWGRNVAQSGLRRLVEEAPGFQCPWTGLRFHSKKIEVAAALFRTLGAP